MSSNPRLNEKEKELKKLKVSRNENELQSRDKKTTNTCIQSGSYVVTLEQYRPSLNM